MDIDIDPCSRSVLREAMIAHRASHAASDLDYVRRALGVSLNTFKKCIADDDRPLRLKRHTLLAIVRSVRLDPAAVRLPLPETSALHGGYDKASHGYLAGRYVGYRRGFAGGRGIERTIMEICWDDAKCCLRFTEQARSINEGGAPEWTERRGEVFIQRGKRMMSLLSVRDGEATFTLAHLPGERTPQGDRSPIRIRGAQLSHGFPRGDPQPVLTAVHYEEVRTPPGRLAAAGPVEPHDPEHRRIDTILSDIELTSVAMTPLLRRLSEPALAPIG